MRVYGILAASALSVIVGLLCIPSAEGAATKIIRVGQRVRVTIGPAPLILGAPSILFGTVVALPPRRCCVRSPRKRMPCT